VRTRGREELFLKNRRGSVRCCFPVTSLVISAGALLRVSAISVKLTTESSTASHTHHRKQHRTSAASQTHHRKQHCQSHSPPKAALPVTLTTESSTASHTHHRKQHFRSHSPPKATMPVTLTTESNTTSSVGRTKEKSVREQTTASRI